MGTYSSIHINAALADYALKYRPADLIADLVSPVSLRDKPSDSYFTFSQRDVTRIEDDLVEPTGTANQRKFTTGSATYTVKRRALMDFVPLEDIAAQDEPLDLEGDTVEDLYTALMLGREKRVADLVTTAASYATANKVTLGTAWTNSGGTPIADINTGIRACAMPPNVMVLDEVSWHTLRSHTAIIATLRGTSGATSGQATEDEVARYFGLESVYVGKAKYDSANRSATASLAYIWPQGKVLIARIPREPRTKDAMLTRTFRFRGSDTGEGIPTDALTGAVTTQGITVMSWADASKGTEGALGIRVALKDDEKMVAADCGYLISNAA